MVQSETPILVLFWQEGGAHLPATMTSGSNCRAIAHQRLPRMEDEVAISNPIAGVGIPDSRMAREATQLVRDTASDLLFYHSTRVYLWGVLVGKRKGLVFDPELLYVAAMFHDIGLTARYRESRLRFEVDGANAAREFLHDQGISEREIERVWAAVALHNTPGIPEHAPLE